MSQPPLRAVLDTGVWIDIYLQKFIMPPPNQPFKDILDAFFANEFVPVYSDETFEELHYMLTASKSVARKHGLDPIKSGGFIGVVFAKAGEHVSITGKFHVSSDENDDSIAETALAANVDFLVADDRDLHEPQVVEALRAGGIKVVWAKQFRKALRLRREPENPPTEVAGEPKADDDDAGSP